MLARPPVIGKCSARGVCVCVCVCVCVSVWGEHFSAVGESRSDNLLFFLGAYFVLGCARGVLGCAQVCSGVLEECSGVLGCALVCSGVLEVC